MPKFFEVQKDVHLLKCLEKHWGGYSKKTKTHSIRKADRDFKIGDLVCLHLWDPENGFVFDEFVMARITYIVTPEESLGLLAEGNCDLSLVYV